MPAWSRLHERPTACILQTGRERLRMRSTSGRHCRLGFTYTYWSDEIQRINNRDWDTHFHKLRVLFCSDILCFCQQTKTNNLFDCISLNPICCTPLSIQGLHFLITIFLVPYKPCFQYRILSATAHKISAGEMKPDIQSSQAGSLPPVQFLHHNYRLLCW